MMRRDGSFVKSERLKIISKQIKQELPNPVDLKKLRLWIEINIGLTPEKAESYISVVVEANGWVVNDGKICSEL